MTTATIATNSRKHNSNHLSVHQWIRSIIRESQQPTLPIGTTGIYATALCGTTGIYVRGISSLEMVVFDSQNYWPATMVLWHLKTRQTGEKCKHVQTCANHKWTDLSWTQASTKFPPLGACTSSVPSTVNSQHKLCTADSGELSLAGRQSIQNRSYWGPMLASHCTWGFGISSAKGNSIPCRAAEPMKLEIHRSNHFGNAWNTSRPLHESPWSMVLGCGYDTRSSKQLKWSQVWTCTKNYETCWKIIKRGRCQACLQVNRIAPL